MNILRHTITALVGKFFIPHSTAYKNLFISSYPEVNCGRLVRKTPNTMRNFIYSQGFLSGHLKKKYNRVSVRKRVAVVYFYADEIALMADDCAHFLERLGV
jgi:hypothetical protein